jgi:hypothetical protein
MKPYDKITIIRNRHRARDLRIFRDLVQTYFERSEHLTDDMLADWEGARAARSEINQMLPRVIQIVRAAGLETLAAYRSTPAADAAEVEILCNIFSPRYADGAEQEILDLIDMALGIYEASRFNALARTVNPFHYTFAALGWVAQIPQRVFTAVGILPLRPRAPRIQDETLTRLEAVVSRLANADQLIENRFAGMRDRQAQLNVKNAGQIEDLAERLDFAERVMAQQQPIKRLNPRNENDVATSV